MLGGDASDACFRFGRSASARVGPLIEEGATLRAALFTEVDEPLSIEEVTAVAMGPHDVVVRVGASGVCHSDLSIARGYVGRAGPMVLGHEGAGTVEEVGAAVTRVEVGDRVVASFVPVCGTCWWCLHEQTNLCAYSSTVGSKPRVERKDGSTAPSMTGLGTFSDVMTVDEASVVPVHTDLPDEQLALIGCGVTTGVGAALNTARIVPGSSVAVIGCGGVGQSVIQGARIAGARHHRHRARRAKKTRSSAAAAAEHRHRHRARSAHRAHRTLREHRADPTTPAKDPSDLGPMLIVDVEGIEAPGDGLPHGSQAIREVPIAPPAPVTAHVDDFSKSLRTRLSRAAANLEREEAQSSRCCTILMMVLAFSGVQRA